MPEEIVPSIEETKIELRRAYWHEMRKPLVAGVVGVASLFVGHQIDASHQPQADMLRAEISEIEASLSPSEQKAVDMYLDYDRQPGNASPELADTAKSVKKLIEQQRKEDYAGGTFNLIGQIAMLYAAGKGAITTLTRSHVKRAITRSHPAFASERVETQIGENLLWASSIEQNESLVDNFRLRFGQDWGRNPDGKYIRNYLLEFGRDIEIAEKFDPNREGLEFTFTEMLNSEQADTMMDALDMEEKPTISDEVLFKLRIISDIWEVKDTFPSLKEWYLYRQRQVVKPHEFHRINKNDLYLPTIEHRQGGIGLAVGRIAYYWQKHVQLLQEDRNEASRATANAIEGAHLLDIIAPRDDGGYWFDYVESLVKGSAVATKS